MKATHKPHTQPHTTRVGHRAHGQAMVEYIIIATFVILALVAVLATVAPTIAAIFDNTLDAFDPEATPVDPDQRGAVLTLVAEYTPSSGAIQTLAADSPVSSTTNNPPVANDDTATTDQNVVLNIFVLANDSDPDSNMITITAMEAATAEGGSVQLSENGTPDNTGDDYVIYTPPSDFIGTDAFTYTISDGKGGSDTATVIITVLDPSIPEPTVAPSPTPSDVLHDAPFYDSVRNPNWWRLEQGEVFLGYEDWNVEWFDWSGSTTQDVESAMNGTPDCTSTQPYDEAINYNWGESGPTPGGTCTGSPWRTSLFAARWTRTFGLAEDVTVTLTTLADEGIQVIIDDVTVDAISTWTVGGSPQRRSTQYTFAGGEEHTIVVNYFAYTYTAAVAFLIQDGSNPDVGLCNWAMSDEQTHTAPSAWSDSPGANYNNASQCHIALRGAVNLATLTEAPRMTFWERYSLAATDKAWLQIREYGSTGPWFEQLMHQGAAEELAWVRQEIPLGAYESVNTDTGQNVTMNWAGRTIEFRFLLEADNANSADGWWIDDVTIDTDNLTTYTVGFEDMMEYGNEHWLPGGTWAISTEKARGGVAAWSDSPQAAYGPNVGATLQLDGIVDLTDPVSIDPELVFYHAWNLGAGDSIFVEVSADGETWTSLTPNQPGGALATGSSTNQAFTRQAISLNSDENPYQGSLFYLRFRLQSDGSEEGDGWWIDDIKLQNRPHTVLLYPFFDNMENGGDNWLTDSGWAISPEEAYSGSSAWTDSPGTNYAHQTNIGLQSAGVFSLTANNATNPELSFWHKRDLGAGDSFVVEASTDGGSTWQSLWQYAYTDSTDDHVAAPGTPLHEFNQQLSWEYVSVNMATFIGTPFSLRFRLDARTDAQVADGVWIDDIRLAEHVETPHVLPFRDNMEATAKWRFGGTWAITTETSHGGVYALTDSPDAFYGDDTWSVLELTEPVNLTSLTQDDFPVLSWWDRFSLGQYDYARLQISAWEGPAWSDWSSWQEVYQQAETTTLSWDRRQVDLRPYIGQKIRLRFVLDGLQNTLAGDGWWIDDVSVALYTPTVVPYMTFLSDATNISGWTTDGTWGLDSIIPLWGSNTETLGAGAWDVTFYDLEQYITKKNEVCGGSTEAERAAKALSGTSFPGLSTNGQSCTGSPTTFTAAATATDAQGIAEIAFNCGAGSSPNPDGTCSTTPWENNHDHMAISFVRSFTVQQAGYYEFSLTHDDGARLYMDDPNHAGPYIDQWTSNGSSATRNISLYLSAGSHTIEIWYYEDINNAVLELEMARPNFSYHDSPGPGVAYGHQFNASLTWDSLLDMTGANNPRLSWYNMFDLGNYDCIVAEISLPYVAFEQWFEVYRQCGAAIGSSPYSAAIRTTLEDGFDLTPGTLNFDGVKLAVRFRLDARVDEAVGDGWWIDDIAMIEQPTW